MEPLIPVILGASLCAGFIQGFSGFGSVLVALPILLTVLDVRVAVPLVSLVALSINVVMVLRLHGHIERGSMKMLLLGSVPGMAVGAWLLEGASDSLIKGLLGAIILAMVTQSVTTTKPRAHIGKGWTLVAGFLSGCIGPVTGANGPPVIAWAARQPWGRDALRATLTFYFLLTGIGIVGIQSAQGLVSFDILKLYALALPALLGGLWAGGAACGKVNERTFRTVVLTLLGIIGLTMLWQAGKAALATL
ncbi:MAG: hypothetical protein FD177_186 [Desulfovibrionaceae bacterium]|nr:MAG: hypothetical protein FD177_186 [Desulfovibrionaceae bacterium]